MKELRTKLTGAVSNQWLLLSLAAVMVVACGMDADEPAGPDAATAVACSESCPTGQGCNEHGACEPQTNLRFEVYTLHWFSQEPEGASVTMYTSVPTGEAPNVLVPVRSAGACTLYSLSNQPPLGNAFREACLDLGLPKLVIDGVGTPIISQACGEYGRKAQLPELPTPGSRLHFSSVGGTDFGPFEVAAHMPKLLGVYFPNPADVGPTSVTWLPHPGGTGVVTVSAAGSYHFIECVRPDADGGVEIPQSLTSWFIGRVGKGITRRATVKTTDAAGAPVEFEIRQQWVGGPEGTGVLP